MPNICSLLEKCKSELYWGFTSPLVRMDIIKKSMNSKCWSGCWRGCGKKGPLVLLVGIGNWCSHDGEQYGDSLKTLGIKPPCDPAVPLLGIYPEKTTILKDTGTPMFIVALFIIASTCVHEQMFINRWMDTEIMVHVYTVDYYSAIERNELESVLMRWMNLVPIMQSKISQRKTNIVY